MKLPLLPSIACATLALFASGCEDRQPSPTATTPAAPASVPTSSPAAATDRWAGKWNGPEGTYLELTGTGGRYEVTIRNLDGPRTFPGLADREQVAFERDGVKEHLRATNGAGTGMKWLSAKSDCLTVRAGEGYCRD